MKRSWATPTDSALGSSRRCVPLTQAPGTPAVGQYGRMGPARRGEEQHVGTKHLSRLQFDASGPVVEGEWTVPGTAQDR